MDRINAFIKSYKRRILDIHRARHILDFNEPPSGRNIYHPVCHDIRSIFEQMVAVKLVDEAGLLNHDEIGPYLNERLRSGHLIIVHQDTNPDFDGSDTHWLVLVGIGDVSLLIESNLRDCATVETYGTSELIATIKGIVSGVLPDTYDNIASPKYMMFEAYSRRYLSDKLIEDFIRLSQQPVSND